MKILRWMCDDTRKNRIQNDVISKKIDIAFISKIRK